MRSAGKQEGRLQIAHRSVSSQQTFQKSLLERTRDQTDGSKIKIPLLCGVASTKNGGPARYRFSHMRMVLRRQKYFRTKALAPGCQAQGATCGHSRFRAEMRLTVAFLTGTVSSDSFEDLGQCESPKRAEVVLRPGVLLHMGKWWLPMNPVRKLIIIWWLPISI